MMKYSLLALAFIGIASCSEAQESADPADSNPATETTQTTQQDQQISRVVAAADFKAMLDGDIQLIDVRTAQEVAAGKIGDATNIDFYASDFKDQIAKLDKSKRTLIYCASGGRSGNTAQMMKSMGFKEVYDLQGGFKGWPYK